MTDNTLTQNNQPEADSMDKTKGPNYIGTGLPSHEFPGSAQRMVFSSLSQQEAFTAMEEWIRNAPDLPDLGQNYKALRTELEELHRKAVEKAGKKGNGYELDVSMGLGLYNLLSHFPDFTMREASDDGFWRYLSLKVAPHLVKERWGLENEDHYWKKSIRIWFRSLWWYVHLSWQGSIEKTEDLLCCGNFDTDTILNLSERTGKEGTFIAARRELMRQFGQLSPDTINGYAKKHSEPLFRVIMKLHTAKIMVMEPDLCEGGVEGYVTSLFEDAGISVKKA